MGEAFCYRASYRRLEPRRLYKAGTQNTEGHRLHEWIVVYLNIKDFRYINESWGEEDGNLMLQFIYRMLSGLINEEELVSRSSMDHFFLLLKEEDDREVNRRILKMKEAVNERIRCNSASTALILRLAPAVWILQEEFLQR